MTEFDKIYLSWRHGAGERRHIVGVIKRHAGSFIFSYIGEQVENALKFGFTPYTEFPNINIQYNGKSVDVFAQRLTKTERPDSQSFYEFWEIDPQFKNDKFYMLGHTQGLLSNDNFEFLADYNPVPGVHFLTELAGLSKLEISSAILNVNDELTFRRETDNLFDPSAVAVYKDDTLVGYIKQIHCRIFGKNGGEKLKLVVKSIEKNGIIKRAFIKVYNPEVVEKNPV